MVPLGSIGTQTLDVVRRLGRERAVVVGLAARRRSALLAEQAQATGARTVATEADGDAALVDLATMPDANTVVIAVAGAAALEATIAAARLGRRICLATKEVLVAAGDLVMRTVRGKRRTDFAD